MTQPIELLTTTPGQETFDIDLRDRVNALIVAVNELNAKGRIEEEAK